MKAKDIGISALKMALKYRPLCTVDQTIFHFDRGIQYTCEEFVTMVGKNKHIVRSMNGKGNCYDNTVAARFFKMLKVELIYQNKYHTKSQAKESIFEYIEVFYKRRGRHSKSGNPTKNVA